MYAWTNVDNISSPNLNELKINGFWCLWTKNRVHSTLKKDKLYIKPIPSPMKHIGIWAHFETFHHSCSFFTFTPNQTNYNAILWIFFACSFNIYLQKAPTIFTNILFIISAYDICMFKILINEIAKQWLDTRIDSIFWKLLGQSLWCHASRSKDVCIFLNAV